MVLVGFLSLSISYLKLVKLPAMIQNIGLNEFIENMIALKLILTLYLSGSRNGFQVNSKTAMSCPLESVTLCVVHRWE